MKPVVIVGAGFSGLISLKICLENGLDAVCYERMDHYGGLWRFREEVDEDGVPSVTRNTIIDTSKEVGALSDFPPPTDFANYMHNTKMFEYLGLFMKANRLEPRVRYRHEVVRVHKAADYEKSGDWIALVRNKESGEEELVEALAVLVCTGHHAFPNYPTFLGQKDFQGPIIHSHSFKDGSHLAGKRVLVVGVGNSAMDAAAELSFTSKQVYLSTRKGAWISPRMGPNGRPLDFYFSRFDQYLHNTFPGIWRKLNEDYLNGLFDHELYGLKPRHRLDQQHPSLSDIVPPRILAGAIKVKGDVARFTSTGAIFKGDEGNEVELDAVVLCTGYNIRIPFLPEDDAGLPGAPQNNQIGLFERIFPVQLPHPTLAFVGMCQPIGPLFPIMELQARWICQLLVDHKRPIKALRGFQAWPTSVSERADEVAQFKEVTASRFAPSQRHTIELDYVTYMENLARRVGCNPNLCKMAFTDPVLCWKLFFGPFLPYQFRLGGPNRWNGARNAIMTMNERVEKGFNTGRGRTDGAGSYSHPLMLLAIALAILSAFIALVYMFFTF